MVAGSKILKSTLKFKVISKKINLQLFAKLWAKVQLSDYGDIAGVAFIYVI